MTSAAPSRLLYNLLLPFALLAMAPGAWKKMRARGGSPSDLKQRLGLYPTSLRKSLADLSRQPRRAWIHAVSVGEVNIAIKLLKAWRQRDPDTAFFLSVTTPTAHRIASAFAALHPHHVVVVYSPVDFSSVIRRVLNQVTPHQLVLVEAEVWPNLLCIARQRGLPVSLVNARLSDRSARRFAAAGFFTRPLFSKLSRVLVQEPEDAARWQTLGLTADQIHHTGSIKYDPEGTEPDPAQITALRTLLHSIGCPPDQHRFLLAASTHAGEEAALGRVYQHLRAQPGGEALRWILVPRHVERAPAILSELKALGIHLSLRSDPTAPNAHDGLLVDTTGELAAWQELADIVVIGKSFLTEGGQNPAEAALAQKPVLFGPHMENFKPLVALLLNAQGAIQVADWEALQIQIADLLANPQRALQLGTAARSALMRHHGATQRTLDQLL